MKDIIIKTITFVNYTYEMSRILTGIQSTGNPHLGNILGAIVPAIDLANKSKNQSFLFIADFHSLTQIKNADELKKNTLYTAAAWLSFGLNTKNTVFTTATTALWISWAATFIVVSCAPDLGCLCFSASSLNDDAQAVVSVPQ